MHIDDQFVDIVGTVSMHHHTLWIFPCKSRDLLLEALFLLVDAINLPVRIVEGLLMLLQELGDALLDMLLPLLIGVQYLIVPDTIYLKQTGVDACHLGSDIKSEAEIYETYQI